MAGKNKPNEALAMSEKAFFLTILTLPDGFIERFYFHSENSTLLPSVQQLYSKHEAFKNIFYFSNI